MLHDSQLFFVLRVSLCLWRTGGVNLCCETNLQKEIATQKITVAHTLTIGPRVVNKYTNLSALITNINTWQSIYEWPEIRSFTNSGCIWFSEKLFSILRLSKHTIFLLNVSESNWIIQVSKHMQTSINKFIGNSKMKKLQNYIKLPNKIFEKSYFPKMITKKWTMC